MADVTTDIEEALKAAADEPSETESSTEETGTEEEDEKSEPEEKASKKGKGASSRIQELVAEKKALEAEFEKARGTLTERDAELGKLVDLLQARENDSQVVAKLNELHANPEYKDMIEYLDKVIRGEEVQTKPEFSSKKAEQDSEKSADLIRKLDAKAAEIDDAIAEREAELLWKEANHLAADWLSELPKAYGEEDKRILSESIADRVDWDAIEESDGKNLEKELLKGFKATLDWYGKPKGLGTQKEEESERDPEEEVKKLRNFVNQGWGKLKETESNGKKILVPQVSDEEFSKAMAQVIRKQNQLGTP